MSEHIPAYPLAWPLGRPRKTGRKDAPFKTRGSRINYVDAVKRLQKEPSGKHLRVGVNTALTDHGSLARLLIEKGIITELEYVTALADGMQAERERYEKHLSELLGRPVTLG